MGNVSQHLLLIPVCLQTPLLTLVEPVGKSDKIITYLHELIWPSVLIAGLLPLLVLGDGAAQRSKRHLYLPVQFEHKNGHNDNIQRDCQQPEPFQGRDNLAVTGVIYLLIFEDCRVLSAVLPGKHMFLVSVFF